MELKAYLILEQNVFRFLNSWDIYLGQSVPIRVWRSFPLAYTCLWWRKRGWRHWFLEWHLQQALRQYHWRTCSGGNLDVEWSSILWTAGSTVRMLPLFYWTPRDELAIGFHLPAYYSHNLKYNLNFDINLNIFLLKRNLTKLKYWFNWLNLFISFYFAFGITCTQLLWILPFGIILRWHLLNYFNCLLWEIFLCRYVPI